jgi:hypothetical protein
MMTPTKSRSRRFTFSEASGTTPALPGAEPERPRAQASGPNVTGMLMLFFVLAATLHGCLALVLSAITAFSLPNCEVSSGLDFTQYGRLAFGFAAAFLTFGSLALLELTFLPAMRRVLAITGLAMTAANLGMLAVCLYGTALLAREQTLGEQACPNTTRNVVTGITVSGWVLAPLLFLISYVLVSERTQVQRIMGVLLEPEEVIAAAAAPKASPVQGAPFMSPRLRRAHPNPIVRLQGSFGTGAPSIALGGGQPIPPPAAAPAGSPLAPGGVPVSAGLRSPLPVSSSPLATAQPITAGKPAHSLHRSDAISPFSASPAVGLGATPTGSSGASPFAQADFARSPGVGGSGGVAAPPGSASGHPGMSPTYAGAAVQGSSAVGAPPAGLGIAARPGVPSSQFFASPRVDLGGSDGRAPTGSGGFMFAPYATGESPHGGNVLLQSGRPPLPPLPPFIQGSPLTRVLPIPPSPVVDQQGDVVTGQAATGGASGGDVMLTLVEHADKHGQGQGRQPHHTVEQAGAHDQAAPEDPSPLAHAAPASDAPRY